jgi:hypothetical protein
MLVSQPKSRECRWRSLALSPLFADSLSRICPFLESAAGDRCSLFLFVDMGHKKDAFWQNFRRGRGRRRRIPIQDEVVPCSGCNVRVIISAGRLGDHWAGCKKRRRGVGELDSGHSSTRCPKMARTPEAIRGFSWHKTMIHLVLNNMINPYHHKTVLNRTRRTALRIVYGLPIFKTATDIFIDSNFAMPY